MKSNKISEFILSMKGLALTISFLGFSLDFISYQPGFLSPDSIDQYQQALTHRFNDWHPPVMAAFWSLFLIFSKGGIGLFIFHLSAFWVSFYLLFITIYKRYGKHSFLIVLIFFAPFTQNFIGNIWKDVSLATSWLLAFSILLYFYYQQQKPSTAIRIFCFLLLCYGCWVRINALPGLLPLIWLYLQITDNRHLSARKLILKTLSLSTIVIVMQIILVNYFLKPEKTYPEYKLFLHDVAAINKATNQNNFPEFITQFKGFDSSFVNQNFKSSTFDNIYWNEQNKVIFPKVNSETIGFIKSAWFAAITKHPIEYLKHRTIGFLNFLRITDSGSKLEITYQFIHPNNFDLKFSYNALTKRMYRYVEMQRVFFYMKPWFWFLLNLFLVFVSHSKHLIENKKIVMALSYSSLFYILFQFFVFQTDTDFRYFYWNCISLSTASVLVMGEMLKSKLRASKST